MSVIPTESRLAVERRDVQMCVRCLGNGSDWHHRRSRSVRDEHQHCPCNGVMLCGRGNVKGCHGYVHSNPERARALGLIVPRYVEDPRLVPVRTTTGWWILTCEGVALPLSPDQVEEGDVPRVVVEELSPMLRGAAFGLT